mgnify:CR=1
MRARQGLTRRGRPACPQYNALYDTVISVDVGGMVEYWQPSEPFDKPERVAWTNKAQTSLYEFKKVRLSSFLGLEWEQEEAHGPC